MKMPSVRATYFISFIIIASLISTTFYLQKYDGMVPCPLCLLQRIVFALLGVVFFFGMVSSATKFKRGIIGVLACIFSLVGILLSGRQVWLQHLPADKNADCGVSLQYLMHVLPLKQLITKIAQGTAECSVKGWEFLNLSLAEWSLVFFILFLLVSVGQTLRKSKN